MYKLIALDLDGTLLTDSKEISRENLELLHCLIKQGYEIVIATGRSYYSARVLTNNIKEHLIYICNNGNIVRDALDNRILSAKFLEPREAIIVLDEGIKRGLYPFVHVDYFHDGYDVILGKGYYSDVRIKKAKDNLLRIRLVEEILEENLSRVLAMVYPSYIDRLKDFYYSLGESYPNRFNAHIIDNVSQAEGLLEVMNPLGNKWSSIVDYANSKGIKTEEIIALGDNNNDIEMVMNAGLGIAMKNGTDLIKEVANRVSQKDNNESGVAHELREILGL